MTKKQIPRNLSHEHEVVLRFIDQMLEYSSENDRAISGQIAIEREGNPLVMLISVYPNGDYLSWFVDGSNFIFYSFVNEENHCLTCPVEDIHTLQEKINELKPLLGRK